jgi:hypothetical protein
VSPQTTSQPAEVQPAVVQPAVVQPPTTAAVTTTTPATALVKTAAVTQQAAAASPSPTAVNDGPFTVTKNTPLTLTAAQLVGNDTAAAGDTLGVSWVGSSTHGTAVLNANGTVTFTPTAGYTGPASFIYNDIDTTNGYTSPNFATVSLTVSAPVNQAPTAVNDGPFTVTNNTPLTLTAAQLVGNDTDPNSGDTLSVSSVSGATNGTAVLNANGTVTFTPTAGYSGAASFGYKVKDQAGAVSTNTATVSLTVSAPVNQAPTAVNDGPFTVTNNTPLTLTAAQLVGNDTAAAGDTLGVSWVGSPVNGSVVLNANGTVTFTPTAGYTGPASFIYNDIDTTNGYSSPNFATVSLTVSAAPNQAPTAVNDGPFTVANNAQLTLTAAQLVGNDTDPNSGDTLSVSSVSAATNGTAVLNANGTVTFTPTAGYSGAASFGYKVKDQAGAVSANTATVSLTVTAASTAPPINTSNTAVGFADSNLYGETHAQIDASLDDMQAMGVNQVRILIPMAYVEPSQGVYNFATTDYIVNAANQRGMAVLGVLNSTPAWAIPAGQPVFSTPPASNAVFASFASAVATRYAGEISAYEVWNEPNTASFWTPTPSAADYVKLLQATYTAIKAADPNATVIAAGLISLPNNGSFSTNPIDYLSQMYQAGAKGYFDAVAIHPYQFTVPFSQGGPYGDAAPINQVAAMHAVMVANGDGNKLIWSTEYGEPTAPAYGITDATQASFTQDYLTAWSQISYAGPSFIYTTVDINSASTDPNQTFGVVRSDGSWKPAAYVIQQWTAAHPQQSTNATMTVATLNPATFGAARAANTCELADSTTNTCTVL